MMPTHAVHRKAWMPESSTCQPAVARLPYPLRVFLLLSAALTILSFAYSILCRRLGAGLPASFPYYYVPGDMFNDFFAFNDKFRQWGKPDFFRVQGYFMYPAPLAHVFHVLLAIPHARSFFGLLLATVTALLCAVFYRILRRQQLAAAPGMLFVAATALLSYPLLFLFQRWNIEFVIWLVTSVGIGCFLSGRYRTGAAVIGVAASLKFYPFIFLGLLLPRRRYGSFAIGVAAFAAVTLLSLYGIGPTVAQAARWDSEQIAAFSKYFVGNVWGLGYDHSFFALTKALTLHLHPDYFRWARPYSIIIGLTSVALYFLRMWRLPVSNQVLALSVLSVTMAPVSYDYTLLNLYPAFLLVVVLVLQAARRGAGVPYIRTYMVLFAMIFTPQSYIVIGGVRYGAELRAVCLLMMLVLSLRTPLPELEAESPGLASGMQRKPMPDTP